MHEFQILCVEIINLNDSLGLHFLCIHLDEPTSGDSYYCGGWGYHCNCTVCAFLSDAQKDRIPYPDDQG